MKGDTSNEKKVSSNCFYNEMIFFDLIEKLKNNNGWKVGLKKKTIEKDSTDKIDVKRFMGYQITGLLGDRDKGKTFFLKKIDKNNLGSNVEDDEKANGIFLKNISKNIDDVKFIQKVVLDYKIQRAFLNNSNDNKNFISPEISFCNQETLRIITENFIIKNSSIIVLVVSKDSLEDYKILNKIKRNSENKKIIVIHNFYHYKDSQFIFNEISKKFKEKNKVFFPQKNKSDFAPYFFFEKYNSSKTKTNVITHLFYCDIEKIKGSEKKKWEAMNKETLRHLTDSINNCRVYQKKFSLIDNFVTYMNEIRKSNSYYFMKKLNESNKSEEKLKNGNIIEINDCKTKFEEKFEEKLKEEPVQKFNENFEKDFKEQIKSEVEEEYTQEYLKNEIEKEFEKEGFIKKKEEESISKKEEESKEEYKAKNEDESKEEKINEKRKQLKKKIINNEEFKQNIENELLQKFREESIKIYDKIYMKDFEENFNKICTSLREEYIKNSNEPTANFEKDFDEKKSKIKELLIEKHKKNELDLEEFKKEFEKTLKQTFKKKFQQQFIREFEKKVTNDINFFSSEIIEDLYTDIRPGYRTRYQKNEVIIEIEVPGRLESFEAKLLFDLEGYYLKLSGKKKKDYENKDDNQYQSRTNIDNGQFFCDVFLPYKEGLIKNPIPKGNLLQKKGCLEKLTQQNKDNQNVGTGIYQLKLDLFRR